MADVVPKIKMYTFLSICVILLNLSVVCVQGLQNSITTYDITYDSNGNEIAILHNDTTNYVVEIGALLPTGFLPFSSIIVNAIFFQDAFPMNIIIGFVVGIISAIQVFILAMVILSLASNIVWHPDV